MSEQEFLEGIESNQGIIYKLLNLYVDDPDEKQDLYQEVLLQTWRAKDRFRGESKFSTWLYKITLNTLLTSMRKEKRQPVKLQSEFPKEVAHHEDEAMQERSEMLYAAIKTLSEVERALITMHLDGFNNQEIADFAGIKTNHANVKLHRIKEKLTKLIIKD